MNKIYRVLAVVGVDKTPTNEDVYRVVSASFTPKGNEKNQFDWKIECKMLNKAGILETFKNKATWLNICIENGAIKGSSGDLNRFSRSKNNPYVIISQIKSDSDRLLGYKVAGYDGSVKNIPLKEMLAYGNRTTRNGGIPVQNAIFVPAEADKREHYKAYPNHSFITEVIPTNKNKQVEAKKVPLKHNGETLNRLSEIYTPEQIHELKQGKANGVDIRIYANPNLSAKQMQVLRGGLEEKLNVKIIAFPEYKLDAMRYYIDCLENNIDIRSFASSKYDIGQIAELSLAAELGLDISKMSNPKLSPNEMAEIRERLSANIWKDEYLKKDGKWD